MAESEQMVGRSQGHQHAGRRALDWREGARTAPGILEGLGELESAGRDGSSSELEECYQRSSQVFIFSLFFLLL